MSQFTINSEHNSDRYDRPNFILGKSTKTYANYEATTAYKQPNRILYKFSQNLIGDDKLFLDDDFELSDTSDHVPSKNESINFGYENNSYINFNNGRAEARL
jgi:hypothetical protein